MAAFRYLLIGLLAFSPWAASSAFAQSATPLVVSSCGSQSLTATQNASPTVDTTGKLCTSVAASGSTNATIVAPLGIGAPAVGVTVTLDSTDAAALQSIITGVTGAIPAGSAIIGKVGIDQTTPGTTNGVQVLGTTTGGVLPFHLASSAASNNATLVSTGVHTLYALVITGTNTAIADVRIYDVVGSPTCSSATGVVGNFPVITTTGLQGGLIVPIPPQGMVITTGLAYCITGAVADNDNTNAPTGVAVFGLYK